MGQLAWAIRERNTFSLITIVSDRRKIKLPEIEDEQHLGRHKGQEWLIL